MASTHLLARDCFTRSDQIVSEAAKYQNCEFGKNGSSNYFTKICYFLVCIQNDAIVVVVVVIAVVVLVIFIVFVAAVISDDVVIVSVV